MTAKGAKREEQVEEDLALCLIGRDGEEQGTGQRDGDQGGAGGHADLDQGEATDRIGLINEVGPRLSDQVPELLDPRGHRHDANVRCAMTVHAYVLVQTEVGRSVDVARRMGEIDGVVLAEDVTGPYDVIARTEAGSIDELGRLVVGQLQLIEGITRTITCPVVNL